MNNSDIGQSFQKLIDEQILYNYGGVNASRNPDGTVSYKGRTLSILEFHQFVDFAYDSIENSISKYLNK